MIILWNKLILFKVVFLSSPPTPWPHQVRVRYWKYFGKVAERWKYMFDIAKLFVKVREGMTKVLCLLMVWPLRHVSRSSRQFLSIQLLEIQASPPLGPLQFVIFSRIFAFNWHKIVICLVTFCWNIFYIWAFLRDKMKKRSNTPIEVILYIIKCVSLSQSSL